MARIAITGGAGEGKSTVLGYLRELGHPIASADEIAREVFSLVAIQGRLAEIVGGRAPVTADQVRAALADPWRRRQINAITHPEIVRRLHEIEEGFVEIPLLIETCLQGGFDRVWVVTCGVEEQRRRLVERLGGEAAAEALLGSQLPTRAKIPFADVVIRTNQPEWSVKRDVALAARQ